MKEENGGTKETERLIYESSLRVFERELERSNELNNKSSTLLATGSAIIAIFVGLGIPSIKELSENEYYFLVSSTFIGAIIVIFLALVCSLEAYNLKKFKTAPNPQVLISEYSDKNEREVMRKITGTIAKVRKENYEINEKTVKIIKCAFLLLGIGIALVITYTIMFIILIR